jgi:anti-sigma B factor antagonist
MELVKEILENNILKINIGSEIDEESKSINGTIELDIENQNEFIEYINNILDEGLNLIILSLENISYIDSSGLWALFESYKKTEQRNGKIVLLNPRADVKRVLDITKISSKIKIVDSVDTGISFLLSE